MTQTEAQKRAQKRWLEKIKGTARGMEYKVLSSELTKAALKIRYAASPEYRIQQKAKGQRGNFFRKYYKDFEHDFCICMLF